MEAMAGYYDRVKERVRVEVMEGAGELLEELERRDCLMGLVTGNLEPIAWSKLEKAGLKRYFKAGGFGSDHICRTELVKTALKRVEENYGFRPGNEVFLLGDAPQDMQAGREAGIITIGIAGEIYSKEDLEKAGADHVVDDLKDTGRIINIIWKNGD